MPLNFPSVRVGQPIRHQALSVFPLFTESSGLLNYLLSDEAIRSSMVLVEEVGSEGTVPELLLKTRAIRVFCSSKGNSWWGPSRTVS